MSTLVIRSATNVDIDHIMELEALGFPEPIRESRTVMQTRLDHFPDGFLVLDNDKQQPIGYFCSELWQTDAGTDSASFAIGHDIRATHRPHGNRLYISSMTIHPQHRGNGVGRQFFTECLAQTRQRLPQIRHSTLLLSAEWLSAHRIYQQLGYAEVTRLPQFFSLTAKQDADAIVMHKDFA